jgi:hypothetical protein
MARFSVRLPLDIADQVADAIKSIVAGFVADREEEDGGGDGVNR